MITQIKLLKLLTAGLFGALALAYCLPSAPVGAFSSGPLPARTGAPALGSFPAEPTCTACHATFPLNSGPGTLTISGLPTNYSPNQEVTVTVTLSQPDRARYGFQATALDEQGRRAGTFVVTDTARTRLLDGTGAHAGRQYIEHNAAGVTPNGTNQSSWTFTWRAPEQNVGRVTFYVAGNAANGNGGSGGDYIYTINASVQGAALAPVASVSAASFAPEATLAREAIVAAFGSNLAGSTLSASGLPLPTDLGGVKVRVRDSAGVERDAGLFFVSAGQINYLIPAGTANGAATVTVLRDNNPVAAGNVTIETVAPGLFSANASGQGVAAAVLQRRNAAGQDSFEAVARLDPATGRFVATPIDLGPETDELFLILFGTGLRGRSSLQAVTAQIGGMNAEVLFVGATPGFAGLDQANVRLPRTLAGRGDVNIMLNVDGKAANVVLVNVR